MKDFVLNTVRDTTMKEICEATNAIAYSLAATNQQNLTWNGQSDSFTAAVSFHFSAN